MRDTTNPGQSAPISLGTQDLRGEVISPSLSEWRDAERRGDKHLNQMIERYCPSGTRQSNSETRPPKEGSSGD